MSYDSQWLCTLLTISMVSSTNRSRINYACSIFLFFILFPLGFILALFVCLCCSGFHITRFDVRLFPPLIFELNCGKLLNFMWQMCERLRLNKYFNRSEWWSINHDDKLGGHFTLASPPLPLVQSRHCICVIDESRTFSIDQQPATHLSDLPPIRPEFSMATRYNHTKIVSIALWMEC